MKRVPTRIKGIRKLDRSVAAHAMDAAGITRKNADNKHGSRSFFSKNWRSYAEAVK